MRLLTGVIGSALLAMTGFACTGPASIFSCDNPDLDRTDNLGRPDPCGRSEYAKPSCEGRCVEPGGVGYDDTPVLLWVGPKGEAPACPERASTEDYHGFADLVDSFACPPCECQPPTGGKCALGSQITAHAAACGSGGIATPTDAPSPWAGGCSAINPIPAGAMCNGTPCVQSVTVEPPTVTDPGSCAVAVQNPAKIIPSSTWQTEAMVCLGRVQGKTECNKDGLVCVPSDEAPPPGFQICLVRQNGDDTSPCRKEYPNQKVFYDEAIDDNRTCSACGCGTAEGSYCSANVVLYDKADCSQITAALFNVRSDVGAMCTDVAPGTPILSKAALDLTYHPGVCQPTGGEPQGEVSLNNRRVFCCKDPATP